MVIGWEWDRAEGKRGVDPQGQGEADSGQVSKGLVSEVLTYKFVEKVVISGRQHGLSKNKSSRTNLISFSAGVAGLVN